MKKLIGIALALLLIATPVEAKRFGNVEVEGTFDINLLDCTVNSNGGKLTTDADGTVICGDDNSAAAASGDSVTVNGTTVDTTANFLDNTVVEFDIADGGAGGPDAVTGTIAADGINDTHIDWGVGAGQVSMADMPARQQSLTVCKSGCAYSVIQTAIDAIGDNASDKPYVIQIYPGTYTENVVMEEYVSLVGFDHETTEITSASGVTVTAPPGTSDASISNLTLTSTPTADGAIVLLMTTGELDVYDTYLNQTSATAGVEGMLIDHNAGELTLEHCDLNYDLDGNAAVSAQQHNIIDVLASSTTSLVMSDCDYFADIADVDDIAKSINIAHAAGETAVLYLNNNRFKQNMSGAYTGTCSWLYSLADGTDIHLISNSLHLSSAQNGTSYGILLNSAGDAGEIHSTANHIQIEDFATNYGLSIASGDTFFSHFDDVVAASGNIVAGTITAVQSPSDGNFLVTGNITPTALTASEIVITDASKNLASAAVATYPSLAELAYVKGATSAIQGQIDAKSPSDSPTFTTAFTATGLIGDEDLQSEDFGEFTCAGEDACTIDDSVAVTSWNLTTPTITTSIDLPAGAINTATEIAADIITHAQIIDTDQADTKCIWFEDPTADDDFNSIWANKTANDFLITELWCESDQTLDFDLQVDDGSPADVSQTDVQCAAGEGEDTSLDGDTTVAAGEELDLIITSVANTPTWVSICFTGNWVD